MQGLADVCGVVVQGIVRRLQARQFAGSKLSLVYLRNPVHAAVQGAAHLRWWTTLFKLAGAAEVTEGGRRLDATSPDVGSATPSPEARFATTACSAAPGKGTATLKSAKGGSR